MTMAVLLLGLCAIFEILNIVRADVQHLPTHAVPLEYEITLEPEFENFTFSGTVDIYLNLLDSAFNITLNSHEISVSDVSVSGSSANIIIPTIEYDVEDQFLILNFVDALPADRYHVVINFTGQLNDDYSGFYRSSYTDETGNTTWLATTQFEAATARKAFPCFDEPSFKALFTINIIRPEGYNSISNTNLKDSIPLNDSLSRYMDTFEQTVAMSTYLVAFVVSDYERKQNGTHAVYARREIIDSGRADFALESGVNLLEILANVTAVPYALEKMYQVAVNDSHFIFGAMENWGLVVYKERYLSYNVSTTTSSEALGMVKIIAHEFAHQWFGNLVSPHWWSDIWLNEGFATYFEWYACSIYKPAWRMMEQMLVRSVQIAMESDALERTRPMTSEPESTVNLMNVFDTVAYDKSGGVIRMVEHILTSEVFLNGLTIYLNNRRFSNSNPSHLWNALQQSFDSAQLSDVITNGQSVATLMLPWTSQRGYPVVNVERNYNDGTLTLSQSRFLLSGETSSLEELWPIPINYASASNADFSNTSPKFWFTERETNFTGEFSDPDSWIILNKQQTGYYRVNYDETNWALIINYLNNGTFENIHVLNRAQIISDAFALAQSGRLNYTILLDLLEYVSQETDYIPYYSLTRGLNYLSRILAGTSYYEKFKKFVVNILQAAYSKVGNDLIANEPITDVFTREIVIYWLCLYGDDQCLGAMNGKLSSYADWVAPDLQAAVYCGGMRNGSVSDWDYLYNKYSTESTEELEKARLITALGCSLDEELLNRLIDAALGLDEKYAIRSKDVLSALSAVYTGSSTGAIVAFKYVLNNFENVTNILTRNDVNTIITAISQRLTTESQQEEFQQFVNALSTDIKDTYNATFTTASGNIDENLKWLDKSASVIQFWLDSHEEVTTTPVITTTPQITTPTGSTAGTTTPGGNGDGDDDGGGSAVPHISIFVLVICSIFGFVVVQ